MKQEFKIRIVGTATLTLDDKVVKGVDDGWRKQFYPLRSPKEIAEHIGYNMMVNDCTLSEIDGFADRKDGEARLTNLEWDHEDD